MTSIYLHAIGLAVGEQIQIETLPQTTDDPNMLSHMRDLGLRHYRQSIKSATELASQAMSQTLAASPVASKDIDALIISTTDTTEINSTTVLALLDAHELTCATPIGLTLADCGNFGSALHVASSLLSSNGFSNVLLVTTDVCPTSDRRILTDTLAVLSDGAASCLLSRSTQSDVRVLATGQLTDQRVRAAEPAEQLLLIRRGLKAVVAGVLDRAGLGKNDIEMLIMNNLNREAIQFMGVALGLLPEACYTDNLADYGHVHSGDVLINLSTHLEDGVLAQQTLLALSHSYGTWGATALQIAQ